MKSYILPVGTISLFAITFGAGCSQNKAAEPKAEAPLPSPPVAVATAKPAPKPVVAKPEPTVDWKKFVVNAPVSAQEKKRPPRPAPNPLPERQVSTTSEEAPQRESSQPEPSTSSGQTSRDFILSTADTIENSDSVSELAGIWLDLDHLYDQRPTIALAALKSAAQVKQDMLLQPEYAKQYRRGLNLHLSMARKHA